MSINPTHQINPYFNEHDVSFAMIKILEGKQLTYADEKKQSRLF